MCVCVRRRETLTSGETLILSFELEGSKTRPDIGRGMCFPLHPMVQPDYPATCDPLMKGEEGLESVWHGKDSR